MTLPTPAELTCIPIITKYQSSLITFYAELKHKILMNLRSLLIYTTWYPDGFDKKKKRIGTHNIKVFVIINHTILHF